MAPATISPTTTTFPSTIPLDENKVTSIHVSDEERISAIPSAATVGAAIGLLHRDGIVVLDNVVSLSHIKTINDKLCAEVPSLIVDPNTNWNGGKSRGNISQPPPLDPRYMYPDIWANPFTVAVVSAILGPRPHVNYVNGNTALPHTSGRQEVHADLNFNYPSHIFALVANYYLTDTDESNGATEIWLRSHRETHFDLHQPSASWIRPDVIASAANGAFAPIRPSIKAGSVVIRDLRLWHAGRSNPSPNPRIMLAFVHFPWWYQNAQRITLPESSRQFLESVSDRVVYDADFVPGEVDHMRTEFRANFESGNESYKASIARRENVSMARMNEALAAKGVSNGNEGSRC